MYILHYTLSSPLFADLPASTRPPLQQMATIDLGSLRLALETEVTSALYCTVLYISSNISLKIWRLQTRIFILIG